MKARTEYYEDSNERLLAYVDVTGEPELIKEISFGVLLDAFVMPLSVLPLDIFSGKNLNKMTKLRRPFLKIHLTN